MSQIDDVKEFMQSAGQTVRENPNKVTKEEAMLRVRLLMEEALELAEAAGVAVSVFPLDAEVNLVLSMENLEFDIFGDQDLVEIADALTDILYVNLGAAATWGIDIQRCFDEVHRSNMSKFIDGYRDEKTGKWIKGPSYSAADLSFNIPVASYKDFWIDRYKISIRQEYDEEGKVIREYILPSVKKNKLDVSIENVKVECFSFGEENLKRRPITIGGTKIDLKLFAEEILKENES